MSEKVANLVLEPLRSARSDMGEMADDTTTMRVGMTSLLHGMRGVHTLQDTDHGDIATIRVRLDRIERRLEIID